MDPTRLEEIIDSICDRFEAAWAMGLRPEIEPEIAGIAGPGREELLRHLLAVEIAYRRKLGEQPDPDEYRRRFNDASTLVDSAFAKLSGSEPDATGADDSSPADEGLAATGYEILGELGRGGMGQVFRGRDPDLRRDLAIKVLLKAHAARPDMAARFVEEARINGQLQHPGIVPVYDLGTMADSRPYFAMKLVRGRTLSELLADRASPAAELPRFLAIFEQVCQTVAYAHARGVIHRDLKPANIMVGKFGEVQVMDWGLAKVLGAQGDLQAVLVGVGESHPTGDEWTVVASSRGDSDEGRSRTGSAMGTPAYMAPEQARGEVRSVDERSDVFALGSILCKVLTGDAAYLGRDPHEILEKATRADLADARGRLDVCGADPELVAVARRCLEAEPSGRFRDAGEVVRAITAYLEGVQDRLHQAELGRVAAQARAEEEVKRRELADDLAREAGKRAAEERRRRRATAGLATAVVAVLIGGTWFTLRLHWANEETTRANRDLVAANAEAKQRRLEADAAATRSQESLVRLFSATGNNSAEAGDWWTALLWYHRAWEFDHAPGAAAGHRQQIASVLLRCPRLLGICLHKDIVREAEFTRSGDRIVTLTEDLHAYLWDPHRNQCLAALRHEGEVLHVTLDQAGKRVATAGRDGIVHLWDAADGQPLVPLRHPAAVHWAAFSSDGTSLATACADGFVRLWETDTGAVRPIKIATAGAVLFVVFSPDNSRLLTVDDSEKARVWNVATGEPQSPLLPHRMQSASLSPLAKVLPSFSPDGRWVLSIYNDGPARGSSAYTKSSLHLWQAGTKFSTVPRSPALNQAVFSPDSKQVLAYGATRTVWLQDVSESPDAGVRSFEEQREVQRGCFSPDGKLIATATSGGLVQFWDRVSLLPVGASRSGEHGLNLRHVELLTQLAFSPDGRYLLSAGLDGTARLWQLPPTEVMGRAYDFDCGRVHLSGRWVLDRSKELYAAYSPDGQHEIRFGRDGKATILERPSGRLVISLDTEGTVIGAGFTADGQRAATIGKNEVRIWSAQTGEAIGPGFKFDNPVADYRLDGHGHRLAIADIHSVVLLWDVDTGRKLVGPFVAPSDAGQPLVPLRAAHQPEVSPSAKRTIIALSEDGRYLAAASEGQLGVWPAAAVVNVETGSTVFISMTSKSILQSLELSHDGKHLLIASSDTTARIYETATGKPAGPPLRHPNFVRHAALSRDGRYVATADATQNVRVWDGQTGDLLVPPLRSRAGGEGGLVWFSLDGRRVIFRPIIGKTTQLDLPVLEASIAPSANLMGLLTGRKIDETEGIAHLDINTFRDDPEYIGKAWLSWVDSGLLKTLVPGGDTLPVGMPAPEPKGRELAGWGLAIDPDNDCQILAEEKALSLHVPGGWHDLNPDGSMLNAPRVLRSVEGDFVFTVRIAGDFQPGGISTNRRTPPYNRAGILIWNDSDNFIRLDRLAVLREGKVIGFVFVQVRKGDQPGPEQIVAFQPGTCHLRLERRGNMVIGAFSADGSEWTELNHIDINWPTRLKVGLAGANSCSEPFSVKFQETDLQAKDAVSK